MLSSVQPSYSDHALSRMVARDIFRKQVRRTLNRPDLAHCDNGFQIAEYETSSGVLIRAIYIAAIDMKEPHIVSAIRLGKLNNAFQHADVGIHFCAQFDLAYVALGKDELKTTEQVAANIYCDLNREGSVMGVEVFNFSQLEGVEVDNPLSILLHLPRL